MKYHILRHLLYYNVLAVAINVWNMSVWFLVIYFVKLSVLKNTVLWDMMPCSSLTEFYQYFGGMLYLYLQSQRLSQESSPKLCQAYSWTLNMEAMCCFKVHVNYQTVWHHISEDCTLFTHTHVHTYEGESVNKSQMDIKCKTCDIRTCKKHLFLDTSITNIDTLAPLLYQCVETRSIEVFLTVVSDTSAPLFQPRRHQRNICHRVVNRFTWQTLPTLNRKHFLRNILCIESFSPQKNAQQNSALR
jgi:hypothetical protein